MEFFFGEQLSASVYVACPQVKAQRRNSLIGCKKSGYYFDVFNYVACAHTVVNLASIATCT